MATHTEKGETFRHGEGVSLGISAVLSIAESFLSLSSKVASESRELMKSYQLPVEFSASEFGYNRNELIELCMKLILKDKKRKDNQLRFILMNEPGKATVYAGIPEEQILTAFETVVKE